MIRKTLAISALAFLASCNTLTPDQQAKITQLQQAAVKVCGFLPTAESVLSLINSGPAYQVVDTAANAICNAVLASLPKTPQAFATLAAPSRSGQAAQATVNGVIVKGTFTR